MSLSIKNLTKKFGDKLIISDLTYDFSDTGIYVIKADSGVGKTTLFRIILGIDTEFEGEILNGGIKNCSVCFQEHRLFPTLSALDNVLAACKSNNTEAINAAKGLLQYFGFSSEEFNLLPNEMSGGMKQRVALSRAFIKDCPIILLDEPTKELDIALLQLLYQKIEELSKHKLILLVTHDNIPNQVPISDTIILKKLF